MTFGIAGFNDIYLFSQRIDYAFSFLPTTMEVNENNNGEPSDEITRVFMWCTPRSASTAVLKCLTKVPQSQCWCEPHCWANYCAPDAFYPEFMPWFKDSWGVNQEEIDSVKGGYVGRTTTYKMLREQMESSPPDIKTIFVKELAFAFDGHDLAELPKGFRHTFLLRHPYKVFDSWKRMINRGMIDPSMAMKLTDQPDYLLPKGYHYKNLYDLYQYVKLNLDPNPVVIDIDDLLSDPGSHLRAYCEAVNMPYSDDYLHWKPGRECMDEQWMVAKEEILADLHGGHNRETFQSTGFIEPKKCPDRANLSPDVLECADFSMKYYQEMYDNRLNVTKET